MPCWPARGIGVGNPCMQLPDTDLTCSKSPLPSADPSVEDSAMQSGLDSEHDSGTASSFTVY